MINIIYLFQMIKRHFLLKTDENFIGNNFSEEIVSEIKELTFWNWKTKKFIKNLVTL